MGRFVVNAILHSRLLFAMHVALGGVATCTRELDGWFPARVQREPHVRVEVAGSSSLDKECRQ